MTIQISAADIAALQANKSVTIQSATVATGTSGGGTTGASPPAPPPPAPPAPSSSFGVKVADGSLLDGAGKPLRIKGVNVSGMEYAYIQGWAASEGKANFPNDPFCGQIGTGLSFSALKSWGVNGIRLPLNEASINGQTTYDASGAARTPDPAGNYMAMVKQVLDEALAAQVYVIVDPLHWSAPLLTVTGKTGKVPFSPMGQGPGPNADTSVPAIAKICGLLKGYPNVILDPYNEWMCDQYGEAPGVTDQWAAWRDGCAMAKFDNNTQGGSNYDDAQAWQQCGMQALVTAARGAGFTGPILLGGIDWSGDLSGWLTHMPKDPLNQLIAGIHLYPTYGSSFGSAAYDTMPTGQFDHMKAIQAAGHPVLIGELGGHNVSGTPNEPFTTSIINAAVAAGWSYFGWAWDVWTVNDNQLIKDANGTPTDGYGVAFKAGA